MASTVDHGDRKPPGGSSTMKVAVAHLSRSWESHMLRKQIVPNRSRVPVPLAGEIQIANVATVQVTSEEAEHPIDHAFDH